MQVHDAYDTYDALLQPYAYARARAHAHAGSTVSMCHMRHVPPGIGRGVPPDRWAPPCGSIVSQADQGYACTQCRYFASLGVCIMGTPRHGAEGPHKPKAPRCGSGKTETRAPAHKNRFWMVDHVGTPAESRVGAIAGGWSQESALRKGSELRNRPKPRLPSRA
jgi:hypothetical protein